MAFKGRGRGKNWGRGYDHRPPNFTPYENYPDVEMPNIIDIVHTSNEAKKKMIAQKFQLEDFWRKSCYHLQEDALRIENQSETQKIIGKKPEKRESLANYLKLTSSNFPVELIQGSRVVQQSSKKLKWDRSADQLSLDQLDEFLDREYKDKNGKGEMKQEEDEEDEPQEEEQEESSDDDYNQNIDFDDDEDDMNMEEEPDEDYYE